ncbi:methyltransferase, FxLD system [Sciscionella marina]|uniref:methyltransferase, FxLD system n=1 Tax=Sciscionella marina TaxID=508770 RepID=UPI0003656710|nr:methyltransferase, FxLD system [Sciscionella marina]
MSSKNNRPNQRIGRADQDRIEDARQAMMHELWHMRALRTVRVSDVFMRLGREEFAPEVAVEEVYAAANAVVTKRDEHGRAVSSISAPQIQAFQLEQADVRPGMRVLEIGSGGVNAAMLAELVGDTGEVISIDIDPEITAQARRLLDANGYKQVRVETADAENGLPESAPFDRILTTVGCWDLPPAWITQLTDGGRIVVPLRMRGLTRSLALDRSGDRFVARSAETCGFVEVQGAGAHTERMLLLYGDQVALRFDDNNGPDNPHTLGGVLGTERATAWSGVTVGGMESFEDLLLWLASTLPGFCSFAVADDYNPDERAPHLVDAGQRWFPTAFLHSDQASFAYLVSARRDEGVFELGAHGFGPAAEDAVATMAAQIRNWDHDHRGGPGPQISVWLYNTPDKAMIPAGDPEGSVAVFDKHHCRVMVSWPTPAG